jgi:hypothetical protein
MRLVSTTNWIGMRSFRLLHNSSHASVHYILGRLLSFGNALANTVLHTKCSIYILNLQLYLLVTCIIFPAALAVMFDSTMSCATNRCGTIQLVFQPHIMDRLGPNIQEVVTKQPFLDAALRIILIAGAVVSVCSLKLQDSPIFLGLFRNAQS